MRLLDWNFRSKEQREHPHQCIIIVRIGRISNSNEDDRHEIVLFRVDFVFADDVFFANRKALTRSSSVWRRIRTNPDRIDFLEIVVIVVFENGTFLRCHESGRVVDASTRKVVGQIRVALSFYVDDEFDGFVCMRNANFEPRIVYDFSFGESGMLAADDFSGEFCDR